MKERPRLTGIINQVTILFLISILAVGLFTYYTQNLIADSTVRKHTENLAEEVAAEVKKAVEEYPAHLWLLNYWYEHWDQMDVEYDVEFQTGTLTEKKVSAAGIAMLRSDVKICLNGRNRGTLRRKPEAICRNHLFLVDYPHKSDQKNTQS